MRRSSGTIWPNMILSMIRYTKKAMMGGKIDASHGGNDTPEKGQIRLHQLADYNDDGYPAQVGDP